MELKVGNRYLIENNTDFEGSILHYIGESRNGGGYFEYELGYFHMNKNHWQCVYIPEAKLKGIIDYDAKYTEKVKAAKLKDIAKRKEELEKEEARLKA